MNKAPVAAKHPHVMEIHGDTRTDNYYWLRDDERSDDAVLSYLKAENAYTEACMRGEEALRQQLFSEMVERILVRTRNGICSLIVMNARRGMISTPWVDLRLALIIN